MILVLVCAILLSACSQTTASRHPAQLHEVLDATPVVHPSIFLDEERLEHARKLVETFPAYRDAYQYLIAQADAICELPVPERKMSGRRLLSTSRQCLKRIAFTAMAYHLSGEEKYAEAARRTMLAATEFQDWNPDHFLDVGEMTAALGIGYDWLYHYLDETDRLTIRHAIVEKGLRAVKDDMWWLDATHNWNQVCNGGLAIGALAVRDAEPELSSRTLARSIKLVPNAMKVYEPDGAYPEGPGYWQYGTTYNVLFLEALRSALGTDFGLSENYGAFMDSGYYARHVVGPSKMFFNYSDCGYGYEDTPNVALFWFARQFGRPGLLDHEFRILPSFYEREHDPGSRKQRFYPFLFLWAPEAQPGRIDLALSWEGKGKTPVAFHRSGWDEPAVYGAIKGGTPRANHAHMDIGSFVLDAKGLRWAEDLGKESYGAMEARGLSIWNRSQNSERWKIFRHSNHSHNTLVVDGKLQNVRGFGRILRSSLDGDKRFTILDLSSVYRGQLEGVQRGLQLDRDGVVVIRDEGRTAGKASIRWAMVTKAKVEIVNARLARLDQAGETMWLQLYGTSARWQTYPMELNYDFNRSLEGFSTVGFKAEVPAETEFSWTVSIHPDRPEQALEIKTLGDW
ncbi:MAG: heparinase II/III domain-containing protein [Candidatus Sumerlaeota bacterium]